MPSQTDKAEEQEDKPERQNAAFPTSFLQLPEQQQKPLSTNHSFQEKNERRISLKPPRKTKALFAWAFSKSSSKYIIITFFI